MRGDGVRKGGGNSTTIERERQKREGGKGWRWRFGKRTVEKPLDSYERENSAESRQTDRRWLRLTGFATTLPFLPRWSSCSLIPLFPPSFHPSIPPSSSSSPSVTGALFSGYLLLNQLCFSNSPAIHYARPNTHDPKNAPRSQTGAPHTHTQQKQQQQRDHT